MMLSPQGECERYRDVLPPKVKGYIFYNRKHRLYYVEPGKGYVDNKQFAYVYTCKEARAEAKERGTSWASKKSGTWIVVYE